MSKFVGAPGLSVLFALWAALLMIVAGQGGQAVMEVPTVEAQFMPGQHIPRSAACRSYVPDFEHQFCTKNEDDDVWLVVMRGEITHAEVFVYFRGVRAGDLIMAWGAPKGIYYETYGAVDLYWDNTFAYVVTHGHFDAFSQVGFIGYGVRDGERKMWRGFRSE